LGHSRRRILHRQAINSFTVIPANAGTQAIKPTTPFTVIPANAGPQAITPSTPSPSSRRTPGPRPSRHQLLHRHPGEGRDPGRHAINSFTVIPAKAGIQVIKPSTPSPSSRRTPEPRPSSRQLLHRHPGEGRDPGHHAINSFTVIPAKAGTQAGTPSITSPSSRRRPGSRPSRHQLLHRHSSENWNPS